MSALDVYKIVLEANNIDSSSVSLVDGTFQSQQILSFMNEAGKDISRRVDWSKLQVDLYIGGNVYFYNLPASFHRLVESGSVRLNKMGQYEPVQKVTSPERWNLISSRPSPTETYYHLSQGKIFFSPTLDVDGVVLRYMNKFWITYNKEIITSDGDTFLISERLLAKATNWRWLRSKGRDYQDELAEFEADLTEEAKADRGVS